MKILVMSDLHTEFDRTNLDFGEAAGNEPPLPEMGPAFVGDDPRGADVCVLAGDISVGPYLLNRYLIDLYNYLQMPIVVICGNHEGYKRHDLDELRQSVRDRMTQKDVPIYMLEDSYIDIGDVRFIGSTFWTDFKLFESKGIDQVEAAVHANYSMTDFNYRFGIANLKAGDTIRIHAKSKSYIADTVANSDKTCVVVTHHAPHPSSVSDEYKDHILTPAYASDCTDMIREFGDRVPLWIHGHMHEPFNYIVENTRVVCNPRGYEVTKLKTKIIEI